MREKKTGQTIRHSKVFELLPDLVFIIDESGEIIEYNQSVENFLTRSGDHLTVSKISDIIDRPLREKFSQLRIQADGDQCFRTRLCIPGSDIGMDVELTVRSFPVKGKTESVIIARDITEQVTKELDLLRFSEVIYHTVNPIQITDAMGRIIFVNPAFEVVSGYTRDELIGKNPNVLNSGKHGSEFWKRIWDIILTGKEWVGQVQNIRKNGDLFYTELVISPIINDDKKVVGFLGAHRDITDQKMLEEQLVRSQKMETFGTLAAGIAHEVGNPLTSISSIVQVIQRTTKDQFAQDKLELVKNQINRIAKIIRELVDFSRPSAYEVKMADINAIIRDALNIVQYGKKVHDFSFSVQLEEPLPLVAVVPDQLVQVFLNILMNAVDACEGRKGGIDVASRKSDEGIEVVIRDTGSGIAAENVEKVFDPFFTTKEVGRGTGLGLWVSLGIMKNFGGDIRVESTEGVGSTFTITLPWKGIHDV